MNCVLEGSCNTKSESTQLAGMASAILHVVQVKLFRMPLIYAKDMIYYIRPAKRHCAYRFHFFLFFLELPPPPPADFCCC